MMSQFDIPVALILAQDSAGAAPATSQQVAGMPQGAAPASTAQPSAPLTPTAAPGAGGSSLIFWALPVMLIVMIGMSALAGRKEKKKRQELISNLKKHDRVQTIGGIIGTIIEVSDDDVVIRLEEGRMRVAKSAIAGGTANSQRPGATSSLEAKPESAQAAV